MLLYKYNVLSLRRLSALFVRVRAEVSLDESCLNEGYGRIAL